MKGTGQLILYLDFDGVLHHENVLWHPRVGAYLSAPEHFKLFQHVDLLDRVLEPYPRVQIVLSTSWVRQYGCAKASKNLSPGLRSRVVGATFHSMMNEQAFAELPRGVQVTNDVRRRQPLRWLALDDDYQRWPSEALANFVRTHEHLGLSDPCVLKEFETKLRAMCEGTPLRASVDCSGSPADDSNSSMEGGGSI
jgi:hypothetical protein